MPYKASFYAIVAICVVIYFLLLLKFPEFIFIRLLLEMPEFIGIRLLLGKVLPIGILAPFIFIFIYKYIQLREPKMFSWYGAKAVCKYMIYIIINPAWLRDRSDKSNLFRGGLENFNWTANDNNSRIGAPFGAELNE